MKSSTENQIQSRQKPLPPEKAKSVEFCRDLLQVAESADLIKLAKMERKINLDDAVNGITIRQACQEINEDIIIGTLVALILRTGNFFNISNRISEDQAIQTAFLILDKYPHETIEDFVIMFRNAKSGKYGELYNRLDGQIIFQWMQTYLDEKAAYRENQHRAVKFSVGDENLHQIMLGHTREGDNGLELKKPILEALKKAVDFEKKEINEKDYQSYKSTYIKKIILNHDK